MKLYELTEEMELVEQALDEVSDDVSAFVQGRYFGALEDLAAKEMDAVVGVRIGF